MAKPNSNKSSPPAVFLAALTPRGNLCECQCSFGFTEELCSCAENHRHRGLTHWLANVSKGWRFRLFSGLWGQVETSAMEVDCVNEILFIAKAASSALHPLDLRVDGFAAGVCDPMA